MSFSLPSCLAGTDGRPVGVGCDSEWLCPDLRAVMSDRVSELAPHESASPHSRTGLQAEVRSLLSKWVIEQVTQLNSLGF